MNLHAAEHKHSDQQSTPIVEFCLHGGNSFGRCIKIVSPDSCELNDMKHRQEVIALDNDSFSMTGVSSGQNTSENREATVQVPSATSGVSNQPTSVDTNPKTKRDTTPVPASGETTNSSTGSKRSFQQLEKSGVDNERRPADVPVQAVKKKPVEPAVRGKIIS